MNLFRLCLWILTIAMVSCFATIDNPRELVIEDLPFHKAKTPKAYSDLILKAIKTNRDKPIFQEFQLNGISVDPEELNRFIGMYSSGIGGRRDWVFYDISKLNKEESQKGGFDYAWLDQSDRLGIQIYIEVSEKEKTFYLQNIELRSRLDVIESISFPKGAIDEYKKIDYHWKRK